jgi:SAM-dependent methyltransferase
MGSRCAARRRSHRKWPAASELAVGHVWAREGDNLAGTSTPHRDAIAGITCTHLSSLSCEAISAINKTRSKNAGVAEISISARQIEKAKTLAKQAKVDHLVSFSVIDYLQTGFPKESFDVVWAIESVCHTERKEDFLQEAYRVLKKGGRIIIADGFIKRVPKTESEKRLVTDFYKGMLLPNLYTFGQFEDAMKKTGFKHVSVVDKTHEIVPSAKRFYLICRFMYPLIVIAATFRIVPKIFIAGCNAGIIQYEAVQAGVGGYGIMYGEK